MRAIVKRPYFDNSGLHKAGEVVEVEVASDLVEIIAEENKKEPKAEPKVEVEAKAEAKTEKAKPTTKTRSTKKKG